MPPIKVIVSGGGTGGHIFPAIAIADAIRKIRPDAQILFVGAEGRMEMEKVPQAGYPIEGLRIAGLQRRLTLKNLSFPFKLIASLNKARKIVKNFNPNVAVGVGGYASGPLLRAAGSKGVPTLIQEQNSYPGITNKLLAKKARKICVAYEGMEKFFPSEKIILTGNPVRSNLSDIGALRKDGLHHFNLQENKTTVLIIGGSLGARTINESIQNLLEKAKQHSDLQLIWQTGKAFASEAERSVSGKYPNVKTMAFINRMDLAYSAADIIVSRAGAMSISELCLVGKPAILVPSPNVAEDHQTKNAMALVNKDAAILVKDADCRTQLWDAILALSSNQEQRENLGKAISQMARPHASEEIAKEVIQLAENRK